MARVLSEVFGAVDHKPFASEKIYSMRDAFSIDFFSCTFFEVFGRFEALALFDA
jgi:hypothetical protein